MSKLSVSRYPVMPLRDIVIFPGMVAPLVVGRKKSIHALEHAMEERSLIFLVTQKDAGVDEPKTKHLYRWGTLAAVMQLLRLPDGTIKALVADIVPAVKPQVAHFERYGGAGMSAYHQVIRTARQAGLIVIADVKRGDIGSTAEQYAAAYLNRMDGPDALTVNGYFGADGLRPFVEAARAGGNGLFVLVRTSNPSARDVQDFTDAEGKTLFQHTAQCVASLGEAGELIGARGYSLVGAVVAATYPQEARLLREIMPQQLFLVPGYGAQGAGAEDCAAAFKPDGTGAIVNASRSVIYAFRRPGQVEADWKAAVREAARAFAGDIARALGGT